MLSWWALSNTAKYVRRGSLFEAIEALGEARTQMLRVFAVARGVQYPSFGLTSLLDFEPFELPDQLAATYAMPEDKADVIDAAFAIAELLSLTAQEASETFGIDLSTPWAPAARSRLQSADPRTGSSE